MRRRRNPATMVHSLSCTDAEWERVRERADAAGLSMSRYLVERALTAELPRDGDGKIGPPPRLVLSEGEQQQIHDRIERIYARMSTGSAEEDRSVLARLGRSVSRLAGAAMLDRLCCKPDVGVSQIRTTTVLSSCFCVGQTVL